MPVLANDPVVPSEHDIEVANSFMAELKTTKGNPPATYKLTSSSGFEMELTEKTYDLLVKILAEMAKSNGIVVLPIHAELTTQQAADFLNVSRPFFIGLLEKGEIPFRTVGRHRRIRREDIIQYRNESELKRHNTLDDLAAQAQELRMGYDT